MAYPGGAPVTIVGGRSGNSSGGSAGTAANPIITSTGASTVTDRSVVASPSDQTPVPANASRVRLYVENLDAAINVFVRFGAAASATFAAGAASFRIGPGASQVFEGTTQNMHLIAASGTPSVLIWEF